MITYRTEQHIPGTLISTKAQTLAFVNGKIYDETVRAGEAKPYGALGCALFETQGHSQICEPHSFDRVSFLIGLTIPASYNKMVKPHQDVRRKLWGSEVGNMRYEIQRDQLQSNYLLTQVAGRGTNFNSD